MEVYIRVAQWIAHQTSNLGVAGSSPVMDTLAQIPKLVKGDRFKFYCNHASWVQIPLCAMSI